MKDITKQIRLISLVAAALFTYIWIAGAVSTALPDLRHHNCGHTSRARPEPHCHSDINVLIIIAWPIGIPVLLALKAGANIFNNGAEQWVK